MPSLSEADSSACLFVLCLHSLCNWHNCYHCSVSCDPVLLLILDLAKGCASCAQASIGPHPSGLFCFWPFSGGLDASECLCGAEPASGWTLTAWFPFDWIVLWSFDAAKSDNFHRWLGLLTLLRMVPCLPPLPPPPPPPAPPGLLTEVPLFASPLGVSICRVGSTAPCTAFVFC